MMNKRRSLRVGVVGLALAASATLGATTAHAATAWEDISGSAPSTSELVYQVKRFHFWGDAWINYFTIPPGSTCSPMTLHMKKGPYVLSDYWADTWTYGDGNYYFGGGANFGPGDFYMAARAWNTYCYTYGPWTGRLWY